MDVTYLKVTLLPQKTTWITLNDGWNICLWNTDKELT